MSEKPGRLQDLGKKKRGGNENDNQVLGKETKTTQDHS